jgi:hypothetical protein
MVLNSLLFSEFVDKMRGICTRNIIACPPRRGGICYDRVPGDSAGRASTPSLCRMIFQRSSANSASLESSRSMNICPDEEVDANKLPERRSDAESSISNLSHGSMAVA